MGDNFQIRVVSEGRANLERALGIAFGKYRTASHYAIRAAEPAIVDKEHPYNNRPAKPRRIVFMWVDNKRDAIELPFKLDLAAAVDFSERWLAEQDYGRQPDHDGDNKKGWQLYNEAWGHVDGEYHAVCAVAPAWIMYGK